MVCKVRDCLLSKKDLVVLLNLSFSCTPGSWAQHTGETQDIAGLDDYVASLYWAAATMSSTGYGDIHAHNTASQLIAIAVMLTGLLLYGYCLSSITATLANSAAPKYANNFSVYISNVSHSETRNRKWYLFFFSPS